MPQATYHFSRGFLWGTATSSYQVEGNNTNSQWWQFEQEGREGGQDHDPHPGGEGHGEGLMGRLAAKRGLPDDPPFV